MRRAKGELRTKAVAAVLRLALHQSPHLLTLRLVARTVDVSHTALGKEYGGQQGLFQAAAVDVHLGLASALSASQQDDDDALENLRSMGRAYMRFAHEHRGWMDLLAHRILAGKAGAELHQAQGRSYDLLLSAVSAAQATGQIRPGDPRPIALTVWSAVHGFATLNTGFAISRALTNEPDVWMNHLLDGVYLGLQPHSPGAPDPLDKRLQRANGVC